MRRRKFIAALGGAAIAGPIAAATQQPVGVPRIGLLMGADPREEATKLDAFRGALANSATSTARPSSSRCAMQWGSPTGSPAWLVSWWRSRRP